MAIKTFSAGAVLTASDTNTYLANSGLVYVTSATVGSGVSTVPVSNAFSSTYDSYKIVYTGGSCSIQGDLKLTLGSTNTGYYQNVIYTAWNNTVSGVSTFNGGSFERAGIAEPSNNCFLSIDVYNPYASSRTIINGAFIGADSSRVGGSMTGFVANTTSYTGFTIAPSGGTLTGGTVTVYGYRKA